MKNIQNKQLCKNIRQLRNNRGETLEELGANIFCPANAISQYEHLKREPTLQTAQMLAKHFGITVDELLYSNYSELYHTEFSVESFSHVAEIMRILYPISCSDKALENPDFKTGYEYCCHILNTIERNEFLRGTVLNDCYDSFEKAAEVTDIDGNIVVPEAVANMVWTIFQMWMYIGSEHILDAFHTPIFPITNDTLSQKKYLDLWRDIGKDEKIVEKRKKFKEYYDDKLVELIAILKSDSEWAELGDYYLAQRYSRLIINNGRSSEENEVVGVEMMSSLWELGNQYAQNYVNAFWVDSHNIG